MVGSVVGHELGLDSAQVQMQPHQDAQHTQEPTAHDVVAFLADLEQRAQACGVGPSEWHEVRRRPLWQALCLRGSVGTPNRTRRWLSQLTGVSCKMGNPRKE